MKALLYFCTADRIIQIMVSSGIPHEARITVLGCGYDRKSDEAILEIESNIPIPREFDISYEDIRQDRVDEIIDKLANYIDQD